MKNIFIIQSLIVFISLSGCSHNDSGLTHSEYINKATNQLKGITVKDGISKSEATIIFEIYGFRFFLNNGWGKIESNGDNWEGNVLGHWSGEPIKYKVIINKKTGTTSWAAGPTIINYTNLLEACPNYNYEEKC